MAKLGVVDFGEGFADRLDQVRTLRACQDRIERVVS